jgi:hypothetical protein
MKTAKKLVVSCLMLGFLFTLATNLTAGANAGGAAPNHNNVGAAVGEILVQAIQQAGVRLAPFLGLVIDDVVHGAVVGAGLGAGVAIVCAAGGRRCNLV